jgi:rod shape-determining protein MreD
MKVADLSPQTRQILNYSITVGSVLLCLLLLPTRLPGMELLGIAPNWLLIWVVAWSVKRTLWEAILAGLILGLIQDGMTYFEPSHTVSLILVGVLTVRLHKERYIQEDFISIGLIVFGMTAIAETVIAVQHLFPSDEVTLEKPLSLSGGLESLGYVARGWSEIWVDYQRITLGSAILTSLWAPVVYYPLNLWWQKMRELSDKV